MNVNIDISKIRLETSRLLLLEKQSVFHSKQLNVDFEDMKYVLLRSDWECI